MKSNLIRLKLDLLGLSFDFKMFSFVVKFGKRRFEVFNIVCCWVIIPHYSKTRV